jgi:predicted DsbA family dithiol-disulfide isomerase
MIEVEIYSDVVCPWCYIGKRRWETALKQLSVLHGDDVRNQISVVYRPYQLDPSAPPEATAVRSAYAAKFGGEEKADQIIGQVTQTAATEGLHFRLDQAQRVNTRDAHRLLSFALTQDRQPEMKERLLHAYFTEGIDLGSHVELAGLAGEAGLDQQEVERYLASDAGNAQLDAELRTAAEIGITAVPTFVFDGQFAVPGAQDPEVFLRVLTKLVARSAA